MLQAIGFAPRLEGYGLDKTGVETTERGAIAVDAARPHQRRRRLRDRRRHRQADARPHRRGDGHRRRRDDRGRRDHRDRLRHDPAGDVLPAADRLLRLLRGAGQGEGLRRQGRQVPVLGQRQGQGPRRHRRLRQDRRRREVQRDHRRPPDRPRRHRAAAGADPGPEVGPHRRRGGPQRLRPPDALRGGQGGRRGHRRPHDPPVTAEGSGSERQA